MGKKISKKIEENQHAIYQKNREMLAISSLIAAVLQAILCMTSFFLQSISKNRILYAVMLVLFLIIFVAAKTICEKQEKTIIFFAYFFLTIAFAFGIILGTYLSPNSTATTFCVLFFALPQLFIDKIHKIEIFNACIAIVFCIISFTVKAAGTAAIDTVNVGSFFLISLPLDYFMIKNKVNEIENQKRIIWQNERDGLTQIFNRDTAEQMIKKDMEATDRPAALMVIDIDYFKKINDTFGHKKGDQAIQYVSDCISGSLRESDIVGRFGGDEFIVYMTNINSAENAIKKAQEICNKVQVIAEMDFMLSRMSISVGIATFPEQGTSYETLFAHADAALYTAKESGKNQVCNYQLTN